MEKTTAIITTSPGKSRYAIAHELAAAGYDIILVTDVTSEFEILATELEAQYGVNALSIVCDPATPDCRQQLLNRINELGCEVGVVINEDGKPLFGSNLQRMMGSLFVPKSAILD